MSKLKSTTQLMRWPKCILALAPSRSACQAFSAGAHASRRDTSTERVLGFRTSAASAPGPMNAFPHAKEGSQVRTLVGCANRDSLRLLEHVVVNGFPICSRSLFATALAAPDRLSVPPKRMKPTRRKTSRTPRTSLRSGPLRSTESLRMGP